MKEFDIYPLNTHEAAEVKRSRRDIHGNTPELSQPLTNRSICRRCLRRFNLAEERLLYKYRPLPKESVFAEVGPIYIHHSDCEPAAEPQLIILKSSEVCPCYCARIDLTTVR